jgi:hypothetical protein
LARVPGDGPRYRAAARQTIEDRLEAPLPTTGRKLQKPRIFSSASLGLVSAPDLDHRRATP